MGDEEEQEEGTEQQQPGGVRKAGDHGVLNVKRVLWEGARRWLCNTED